MELSRDLGNGCNNDRRIEQHEKAHQTNSTQDGEKWEASHPRTSLFVWESLSRRIAGDLFGIFGRRELLLLFFFVFIKGILLSMRTAR